MAFALGDPVRLEMTKWGDLPHWEFDAVWLGNDEHGDWIGIPTGTAMSRPGMQVVTANDQVGLSPARSTADGEGWWVATFHGPGGHHGIAVYVDIATPPVWDGSTVRMVDLDLDVIRGREGDVVVDDEDEFAEHQVELGYPSEVVALAQASCDRVRVAVREEEPPYDGSHEPWLALLSRLTARS
jgi:uncharacterized protein